MPKKKEIAESKIGVQKELERNDNFKAMGGGEENVFSFISYVADKEAVKQYETDLYKMNTSTMCNVYLFPNSYTATSFRESNYHMKF